MAKTVFILGAGASKEGGAPVMSDFLATARELVPQEASSERKDIMEHALEAIGRLQEAHSKSTINIHNLESVWTALEMAQLLDVGFIDDVDRALVGMRRMIETTLARTMRYRRRDNLLFAPMPYPAFAHILSELRVPSSRSDGPAVITFNYDLALDLALTLSALEPWYAFDAESNDRSVPVFKLHGSMNWLLQNSTDGQNGGFFPVQLGGFLDWHRHQSQLWGDEESEHVFKRLEDDLVAYQHSQTGDGRYEPFLVPPTWNKGQYQRALDVVWKHAGRHLAQALDIYVIGYSLSATDSFFENLYALSSVGPSPLRRFVVYNTDRSGATEARFRSLIGPGALQVFEYRPRSFSAALNEIARELGVSQPPKRLWID